MNADKKKKVEFGDYQTPDSLALRVCERLLALGVKPDVVIEPTCGVGAFVKSSVAVFPKAHVYGYEVNTSYLDSLKRDVREAGMKDRVSLKQSDFFTTDWRKIVRQHEGNLLILGNLPWVTSAVLGSIGSDNLPTKTNFLGHKGFDAITGKANFDISEWMLLALIRELHGQRYDVAMLLKTATARKIIAYVDKEKIGVNKACLISINTKKEFDAQVEACLLVLRFTGKAPKGSLEYDVFSSLEDKSPLRMGHRQGHMIGDLDVFDAHAHLVGTSPQKWRSGVKHDASSVMEFTESDAGLLNGLGDVVDIEPTYLYPLLKGSDIGGGHGWRRKHVLVTQTKTGEDTAHIEKDAPKTWAYLEKHADVLERRGSSIYTRGPRFSIFGIGDYAFRPWRIAICGLYKKLNFRLVEPQGDKPYMFDDTVYFVSFDNEKDAQAALDAITSPEITSLYRSMIFFDDKRPVKASVLNHVDWSLVEPPKKKREQVPKR